MNCQNTNISWISREDRKKLREFQISCKMQHFSEKRKMTPSKPSLKTTTTSPSPPASCTKEPRRSL